jgi:hypothetical protein
MKKTKSKTPAKKTGKRKRPANLKPETNPTEVRKEVSKMVEAEATTMAQAVIDEGKKGQLATVKYLFEMASIYPPAADGEQATQEEDCLAKMLLDRLKPPQKAEEEEKEEAAAASAVPVEETSSATKDAVRVCVFDTQKECAEGTLPVEEGKRPSTDEDEADGAGGGGDGG